MKCDDARQRLLEAELDDLDALEGSALGRHLSDCDECAAAARAIREQERALGELLAGTRGRGPDETLATLRRTRPTRSWWAMLAGGTAVAAALSLYLVGSRERLDPEPASPRSARVTPAPMEVDSDRSFVVLSTGDPDVTLVWLN